MKNTRNYVLASINYLIKIYIKKEIQQPQQILNLNEIGKSYSTYQSQPLYVNEEQKCCVRSWLKSCAEIWCKCLTLLLF